jgi:hypothetical protein
MIGESAMMQDGFVKPDMMNLRGKAGKEVFDEIKNAKPVDLSYLDREAEECEDRILARRKNAKQE